MPKISELNAATSVGATDVIPIVQSGETKKIVATTLTGWARTAAETSAGVTPSNLSYPPGDVRRYGAVGDGATDDSAAIQAAIDARSDVVFPAGTFKVAGLTFYTTTSIRGAGNGLTTLSYTGSGTAFAQSTPGTRIYNVSMRDFLLTDAGTGTIGLDLDSVSEGLFQNVSVIGFTTGIKLASSVNGGCVYNRFMHVKAQSATTGFVIGPTGSNSNSFIACRGNICTTCVLITNSNQNVFQDCQFETSGTGARIVATSNALSDRNTFIGNRFEGCTTVNLLIDRQVKTITAATSASPIVFTSVAHGFASSQPGSVVFADLPGDFAALNGTTYTITYVDADRFSVAVNGSGYAAYSSGGTATMYPVRETALLANHHVTGTVTDYGSRTLSIEPFGTTGSNFLVQSARTADANGLFRFVRGSGAGSETPAMVIADTYTGSGTPITLQIETERSAGDFVRGTRGGTEYFSVDASGNVNAENLIIGNSLYGAQMTYPPTGRSAYLKSTTASAVLAYNLYANEGTNNTRAQFYVDDSANQCGLDWTYSTGTPPFIISRAGTAKITVNASECAIHDPLKVSNTNATLRAGTGSPEGAVTANIGSVFLRTDGGAGTTLYVKESGTGATGWVGK